jgi:Cu+-exporting ATPase
MKESLQIEGMHCAGCANSVEKALSQVEGVSEASVNLATEKALVEFENGEVTREKLKQAVQDAGYDIKEEVEEDEDPDVTGKKNLM